MKPLKLKRIYAGCYEVINHQWSDDNGRLEIYQTSDGTGWRSSYTPGLFGTLAEAKASTFIDLETDGLGVSQ